ncbi:MAG: hypothetical protein EPO68_07680 [Planctomycetota bacterium]|nr:MAG: hypothetical protein EPO68_07680 [Planctomycetota bacterium]
MSAPIASRIALAACALCACRESEVEVVAPPAPAVAAPPAVDAMLVPSEAMRVSTTAFLRGRVMAPREMPLPADARIAAVADAGTWRPFLHMRKEPRESFAIGTDGAFEFAWPADAEQVTLYADAPTLADVALAIVFRIAPDAYEFGRVEALPRAYAAPQLGVAERHRYVDGRMLVAAHSAMIIVGRLTSEPPVLASAASSERATVRVHAWRHEQIEWSAAIAAGEAFRFEHVPIGGPIAFSIEGTRHWLGSTTVEQPRAGETRDVGVVGELRYPLRGRLIDAKGAPVFGGGVRALELEGDSIAQHIGWSITAPDGRFELARVPLRPIVLRAGRHNPEHGGGGLLSVFQLTPDASLLARELVLKLDPVARLSGTVTGPDGAPPPSYATHVLISDSQRSTDADPWRSAFTRGSGIDAHGRFVYEELPFGEHELCVWCEPREAGKPAIGAVVRVTAPADDVVVRLAPLPPLHGRAVHANGAAFDGPWVLSARREFENRDLECTQSAFEHAHLTPGRWEIRAYAAGGLSSALLELDLPADLAREHVLVLEP